MDRPQCPEILAISSGSLATPQPERALRARCRGFGQRPDVCRDEGSANVARFRLAGDRHAELPAPQSAGDVAGLVPGLDFGPGGAILGQTIALLGRARDEALVFTLHDERGKYICAFDRSGHAGGISLNYRDLIGRTLANGAAGLLLIHNHPSGDPTPSMADVASTRALAALCLPLDIAVHDHLIVGRDRVVSMRRSGLLAALGSNS